MKNDEVRQNGCGSKQFEGVFIGAVQQLGANSYCSTSDQDVQTSTRDSVFCTTSVWATKH